MSKGTLRGMLDVHTIVSGSLAANCYVVAHPDGDAVIVDPGDDFEMIAAQVNDMDAEVRAVLATHAHHDHIGAAAAAVEKYDAPFHLHSADHGLLVRASFYRAMLGAGERFPIPEIDVALEDDMTLRFGGLELAVIHTPGHTHGGVCFLTEGELFSGDTIMADRLGRTDLPTGDSEALAESAALVVDRCPPETLLRPGHGDPAPLGDAVARLGPLPEVRR